MIRDQSTGRFGPTEIGPNENGDNDPSSASDVTPETSGNQLDIAVLHSETLNRHELEAPEVGDVPITSNDLESGVMLRPEDNYSAIHPGSTTDSATYATCHEHNWENSLSLNDRAPLYFPTNHPLPIPNLFVTSNYHDSAVFNSAHDQEENDSPMYNDDIVDSFPPRVYPVGRYFTFRGEKSRAGEK